MRRLTALLAPARRAAPSARQRAEPNLLSRVVAGTCPIDEADRPTCPVSTYDLNAQALEPAKSPVSTSRCVDVRIPPIVSMQNLPWESRDHRISEFQGCPGNAGSVAFGSCPIIGARLSRRRARYPAAIARPARPITRASLRREMLMYRRTPRVANIILRPV